MGIDAQAIVSPLNSLIQDKTDNLLAQGRRGACLLQGEFGHPPWGSPSTLFGCLCQEGQSRCHAMIILMMHEKLIFGNHGH